MSISVGQTTISRVGDRIYVNTVLLDTPPAPQKQVLGYRVKYVKKDPSTWEEPVVYAKPASEVHWGFLWGTRGETRPMPLEKAREMKLKVIAFGGRWKDHPEQIKVVRVTRKAKA